MKNTKISILLIVFFSNLTLGFAQPNLDWVYSNATASFDGGTEAVFGHFGFNYTLGYTYTTPSASDVQTNITKRDINGVVQWTKNTTGANKLYGQTIAVDASDNIYIVGTFMGTSDFNPGVAINNLTSNGGDDNFVLKLDSNGNFVWAKSFGGSGDEEARSVKIDNTGNVVLIGRFMNTVDFDPGAAVLNLASAGSRDVFIQKLSSAGSLVWAKRVGGTDFDSGHALTIDSNDDIITSGMFQGTADFDPGVGISSLTSNGDLDVFILKLNASGNHVWSKSVGGTNTDVGFGITSNSSNDIFITGNFRGTVDFNPGTGTNQLAAIGTSNNCFILKLNSLGDYLWSNNFGAAGGYGTGISIVSDIDDDVYATGYFKGTVDFDPGSGITNLTGADQEYFVVKFDNNGFFNWVINSTGTVMSNSTASVAVNVDKNILLTGYFRETRDFEFGAGVSELTALGEDDIFTMLLSQECVSTGIVPDQVTLANVTSQCSVTSLTAPTATDNCAGTIIGTHNATLPITTPGTTVVTWTYNDGHGNTSTQTQNVIINDNTAPVANTASLANITDQCAITSLTAPTATDNCAGTITGSHNATLPITTQGTTVIIWTYNDGHGNASTQTQNVIISDNIAPIANLANLPAVTGNCSVASLTAPTSTDNCAGMITGTHNATLPITAQGTTVVTWTYNDGHGNTSTQTQNVIINDNTAPVANLANLPNVTGQCSVTSLTAPTATDNCAGVITGTTGTTFPITTPGTTVVTWTYSDGHGNTSTQTQNVIVTVPVATTTLSGLTISATTSGAAYQWINCGNGNAPIAGATSQSFTATANGTYAVIVTQNGCSATSACVAISTVGLEDLTKSLFTVYPNPNTGAFKVLIDLQTAITITNTAGQFIATQLLESGENTIELTNAESGIYFITARDSNGGISVQRVTITK